MFWYAFHCILLLCSVKWYIQLSLIIYQYLYVLVYLYSNRHLPMPYIVGYIYLSILISSICLCCRLPLSTLMYLACLYSLHCTIPYYLYLSFLIGTYTDTYIYWYVLVLICIYLCCIFSIAYYLSILLVKSLMFLYIY